MAVRAGAQADGAGAVDFRPLYRQVQERLVRRIAEGQWTPGALIPSEFQIARDLGVSQGTVRKALDAMTADHLLVRRQGVGTFVAAHDEDRVLFQFFKLRRDDGRRAFPDSDVVSVSERAPSAEARERLGLVRGEQVVAIRRLRSLGGMPAVTETVTVPAARFPGLLVADPVPNNLYGLYAERYGVTIAGATEHLKAIACPDEDAALLGIAAGSPVLLVDRLAADLDGRKVEWRLSICRTDAFFYLADLK
ncbi:GntR family transcriptional regulator [Phreatobacter sp.]|uniref:GntR family transcriptional regulator n=1 Tax=Phreatobacter sp. TaxID=1966341 RepID=UPI003F70C853